MLLPSVRLLVEPLADDELPVPSHDSVEKNAEVTDAPPLGRASSSSPATPGKRRRIVVASVELPTLDQALERQGITRAVYSSSDDTLNGFEFVSNSEFLEAMRDGV